MEHPERPSSPNEPVVNQLSAISALATRSIDSPKPGSPYVLALICGKPLCALVDPGAVTTVISPQVASHLPVSIQAAPDVHYQSVTGSLLQHHGQAAITVQLAHEEPLSITALIAPFSTPADIILGSDYFDARKACINYWSGQIRFPLHPQQDNTSMTAVPIALSLASINPAPASPSLPLLS